eukprot:TRINITY_DN2159_c0_g1_i1.p1 TRINITY_DN2159_c0_g1~~TRINITY_DN2159_c0_g1_i1.p1  ORF type:complete len:1110 (+),score=328.88 TRINITY_DN2159_c0_g1_i1:468-3332(+)
MPVGLCNPSADAVKEVLAAGLPLQYVQTGFHAFLPQQDSVVLMADCLKAGVAFEACPSKLFTGSERFLKTYAAAHTRVTAEDSPPAELPQTPRRLAVAYVHAAYKEVAAAAGQPVNETGPRPVSIAFAAEDYMTLLEVLSARPLADREYRVMKGFVDNAVHSANVTFKTKDWMNPEWVKAKDEKFIRGTVIPTLLEDIAKFDADPSGEFVPSALCEQIPKPRKARAGALDVHSLIAAEMFLRKVPFRPREVAVSTDGPGLPAHDWEPKTDELRKLHAKAFERIDAVHCPCVAVSAKVTWASQKLEQVMKKLRSRIGAHKLRAWELARAAPDATQAVQDPSALPVAAFHDPSKFADINNFIASGGFRGYTAIRAPAYLDVAHRATPASPTATQSSSTSNLRFEHGTLNADGRYDMCKQSQKNAFQLSCAALAADGPETANIRFEHGTLNADGRYDMCKQSQKNAFQLSCAALAADGPEGGEGGKGTAAALVQAVMEKMGALGVKVPGDGCPEKKTHGGYRLVKHYMLGNNRIAEGDGGEERAAHLAGLLESRPDMVTWFICGNELNAMHIKACAAKLAAQGLYYCPPGLGPDARRALLARNARYFTTYGAQYWWMKMNPVKAGAYDVAHTLQLNPRIELVDLFNVGLGNDGLAAFARGLEDGAVAVKANVLWSGSPFKEYMCAEDGGSATAAEVAKAVVAGVPVPLLRTKAVHNARNFSSLKHAYFQINNIDAGGMAPLADIIRTTGAQLESLYLGVNPIGDDGLAALCAALDGAVAPALPRLVRLSLGSAALTDAALPILRTFITEHCPALVCLDLSAYKSTKYFQQKHNNFTDVAGLEALGDLLGDAAANRALSFPPEVTGTPVSAPRLRNLLILNHSCAADTAEQNAALEALADRLEARGVNVACVQRNRLQSAAEATGRVVRLIPKAELKRIQDPYPAIDYILSVYRNAPM